MTPDDPRHGTPAGHSAHVKDREPICDACRAGKAAYARRRRRLQAYGQWNRWVPADPARDHVRALVAAGMPYRHVAAKAGVSSRRVSALLYGETTYPPPKKIRPELAAAILAVTAEPSRVPVRGAGRRLQALMALGHSRVVLAAELGVSASRVDQLAQMRDGTIMRETHDRVDELFRRWCTRLPAPTTRYEKQAATRTKNEATRRGWVPPLAWDDIDLDEAPYTEPEERRGPGRREVIGVQVEEFEFLRSCGETEEVAAARLGIRRLDSFKDQRRAYLKKQQVA